VRRSASRRASAAPTRSARRSNRNRPKPINALAGTAIDPRRKRAIAACLGCGLALALLASLAEQSYGFRELDARVVFHLVQFGGASLAHQVVKVGDLAPQLALLAAAVAVGLVRRRWGAALAAVVLVGGADLTTQLLKHALYQWRFEPLLGWTQVGPEGFPSGHATSVAAMALAWSLVVPARLRLPTLALGALATVAVCWAVVVSRWHYPSDALGGVLVALTWYFAISAVRPIPTPPRPRLIAPRQS
jgi:membrane-associated phospholipid phosphatase